MSPAAPIPLDPFTDIIMVHWPEECPVKLDFVNNKYRLVNKHKKTYFEELSEICTITYGSTEIDPQSIRSAAGLDLFGGVLNSLGFATHKTFNFKGRARDLFYRLNYTVTIEYELFDPMAAATATSIPHYMSGVLLQNHSSDDGLFSIEEAYVNYNSDDVVNHVTGAADFDMWVQIAPPDAPEVWHREYFYAFENHPEWHVDVNPDPDVDDGVDVLQRSFRPPESYFDYPDQSSPGWSGSLPWGASWAEYLGPGEGLSTPGPSVGIIERGGSAEHDRIPVGTLEENSYLMNAEPAAFNTIHRIAATVDEDHVAMSQDGQPVRKIIKPAGSTIPRPLVPPADNPDADPDDWVTPEGFFGDTKIDGYVRIRCIWLCPKKRKDNELKKLSRVKPLKPWK